jgi:hypothetical protein
LLAQPRDHLGQTSSNSWDGFIKHLLGLDSNPPTAVADLGPDQARQPDTAASGGRRTTAAVRLRLMLDTAASADACCPVGLVLLPPIVRRPVPRLWGEVQRWVLCDSDHLFGGKRCVRGGTGGLRASYVDLHRGTVDAAAIEHHVTANQATGATVDAY